MSWERQVFAAVLSVLLLVPVAAAQERTKIKVAALTLPVFNPIIVNLMKEKGIDARHGLELDVRAYPSIAAFYAALDPAAVRQWRERVLTMKPWSHARSAVELGLVGVVSTQLWHHTFIEAALADLPSLARPAAHAQACHPAGAGFLR